MDNYIQKPLKSIKWITFAGIGGLDFGLTGQITSVITEYVNTNLTYFNKIKPTFKFYIIQIFGYASNILYDKKTPNYDVLTNFMMPSTLEDAQETQSTLENAQEDALLNALDEDQKESSTSSSLSESSF